MSCSSVITAFGLVMYKADQETVIKFWVTCIILFLTPVAKLLVGEFNQQQANRCNSKFCSPDLISNIESDTFLIKHCHLKPA